MDEEENTLVKHRFVKLMCDYSAEGVWDIDGSGCLLDDLPVSEDLKVMIRGWQMWFEYSSPDDREYPCDPKAHDAFGRVIACLVKKALPDWTVVCWKDEVNRSEDGTFSALAYNASSSQPRKTSRGGKLIEGKYRES